MVLVDSSGTILSVQTESFICDAPTRSFLKEINGHTGYGICERCDQGVEKFSEILEENNLRTDESFRVLRDPLPS